MPKEWYLDHQSKVEDVIQLNCIGNTIRFHGLTRKPVGSPCMAEDIALLPPKSMKSWIKGYDKEESSNAGKKGVANEVLRCVHWIRATGACLRISDFLKPAAMVGRRGHNFASSRPTNLIIEVSDGRVKPKPVDSVFANGPEITVPQSAQDLPVTRSILRVPGTRMLIGHKTPGLLHDPVGFCVELLHLRRDASGAGNIAPVQGTRYGRAGRVLGVGEDSSIVEIFTAVPTILGTGDSMVIKMDKDTFSRAHYTALRSLFVWGVTCVATLWTQSVSFPPLFPGRIQAENKGKQLKVEKCDVHVAQLSPRLCYNR
ncbi:hypothetical protein CPB86DRAFT_802015 [Serendipita vermifera]|nr:hypothetical protein CPB86DRAFT_802015 [Serendipita vermifera]